MEASGNIIIEPVHEEDDLTAAMKQTVIRTKKDGYILTYSGIFTESKLEAANRKGHWKEYVAERDGFDFENPRLRMLFSILPLILKKSDRKSIYSYHGKHVVEKLFKHSYISNGEFILVCLTLGYKYKYCANSPNCDIYGLWVDTIPPMNVDRLLRYSFPY